MRYRGEEVVFDCVGFIAKKLRPWVCSGRLRDVFCLRRGACLFSFRGSKAAFRHAAEDGFGVWVF